MGDVSLPTLAILCGGMAKRLQDRTMVTPKSLLPIAGKPFIHHQLELLVQSGFQEVVLLCGHLGVAIRTFVGDGSRFDCNVRYSEDGPTLLGTGGAVKKALPLLGKRFVLLYGDSYCMAEYEAIDRAFMDSGRLGLMTLFRNQNRFDRGNVEFLEGNIVRYDKQASGNKLEHIDYGVNAFWAEAFKDAAEVFDLSVLQAQLLHRGELVGFEVPERFYEIGSVEGIESTEAFLRSRHLPRADGRDVK